MDNGRPRRRAGEEALYLHGAGTAVGQNGLRILGQSTLYMPAHVKVYANIGGQVTDLHTLFTGAQVTIPFDEGFISRTLLGDFNLDSILNATDLDLMAAAILAGSVDPLYDVNGIDGVNHEDFDDLVYGIFGSFYGDANLDQSVNLDDLIVLTNNLGNAGSGWVQGDFNGDGRTGLADLHSLRSHFGRR